MDLKERGKQIGETEEKVKEKKKQHKSVIRSVEHHLRNTNGFLTES